MPHLSFLNDITSVSSVQSVFKKAADHAQYPEYQTRVKEPVSLTIPNSQTMTVDNNIQPTADSQIVLYQPDETISLEVKLEGETVWLTQQQMVELFCSSKANVSEHITNILQQGELMREATVRNFRTVRKEGNRMVARNLDYYNLDMIISVGFRVNTQQGIRFRQWAPAPR